MAHARQMEEGFDPHGFLGPFGSAHQGKHSAVAPAGDSNARFIDEWELCEKPQSAENLGQVANCRCAAIPRRSEQAWFKCDVTSGMKCLGVLRSLTAEAAPSVMKDDYRRCARRRNHFRFAEHGVNRANKKTCIRGRNTDPFEGAARAEAKKNSNK